MEDNPFDDNSSGGENINVDSDIGAIDDEENEDISSLDLGEEQFNESDDTILNSGDNFAIAQVLLRKTKKCAADYLKKECLSNRSNLSSVAPSLVITEFLDLFLNPGLGINNSDTILWLKYLFCAGMTPKAFFKNVEEFDNPTTCSLVWTVDFMAYRCRTCGISPCMSLCLECFHKGDHAGHDYNMFKSQAGGACDCGNRAVMQSSGFCCKHNGSKVVKAKPPEDMLILAQFMMPRLFQRFIFYCREIGRSTVEEAHKAMREAEPFIEFLQEICCSGAPMRSIMTQVFCDPEIYTSYTEIRPDARYREQMTSGEEIYKEALNFFDVGEAVPGFEDVTSFHGSLVHKTFIEELMFWTVKFEFPQKLVCLLLNMRPDSFYEDAFAKTFVQHYSRIALTLVRSNDSDTLSHRVVHVSVQLFSDNALAFRMTQSHHLMHIMILSLKKMMNRISTECTLQSDENLTNVHRVASCTNHVMKNHCYWPIVSDLNNILSFRNITEVLIGDNRLLHEWFMLLCAFQGINNNVRRFKEHIDYEPHTYYAAFSAELEISSSPLWALLHHITDPSIGELATIYIKKLILIIEQWFNLTGFSSPDQKNKSVRIQPVHRDEVSFQIPLHRHLSLVLRQAVRMAGVKLKDILPSPDSFHRILAHPLRVQVAFHEIMNETWSRNGLQIKGQSMTYVQCHFCNSLIDPDVFMLQIGAGEMPKDAFILSIFERFQAMEDLTFTKDLNRPAKETFDMDLTRMFESILYSIASIATNRISIGADMHEIAKLEMMALICGGDRTHSQIMEQIPDKWLGVSKIKFEPIIEEITKFCEPACLESGTMRQGMYVPQAQTWEELFDPVLVQLRTLSKKEFNIAMTRFRQYVKDSNRFDRQQCLRLWPPFRIPGPVMEGFVDPCRILTCRTFHAIAFVLLYKCLVSPNLNESLLAFVVYLLEISVEHQFKTEVDSDKQLTAPGATAYDDNSGLEHPDGLFSLWFSSDDIFVNATSNVDRIQLKTPIRAAPEGDPSEDDFEMVEIESYEEPMLSIAPSENHSFRSIVTGSELVPYDQEASAVVPSEQNRDYQPSIQREIDMGPPGQFPSLLAGSEVAVRQSREVEQGGFFARRLPGSAHPTQFLKADETTTVVQYVGEPTPGHSKALVQTKVDGKDESLNYTKYSVVSSGEGNDQFMEVNETLISLLLKLHAKLSSNPGNYKPRFEPEDHDRRIGGGPFFVAKLLNKMGRMNPGVRAAIESTNERLFPRAQYASSDDEGGAGGCNAERKVKADESRRRAMAFFKKKSTQFLRREKMKQQREEDGDDGQEESQEQLLKKEDKNEIKCAICGDRPPNEIYGYVGLITATNVAGQRQVSSERHKLPLNNTELTELRKNKKVIGKLMESRWKHIDQHFEPFSSFHVLDKGWLENVNLQVCGHIVHIPCLKTYTDKQMKDPAMRMARIHMDRTDFRCPVCRKAANAVVPIVPKMEDPMEVPDMDLVAVIDYELANVTPLEYGDRYSVQCDALMYLLSVPTKFNYEECLSNPSIFQFFSSVLRNSIESLLILYGGSLVNFKEIADSKKLNCIASLKICLSAQTRCLLNRRDIDLGVYWLRELWSSLTEHPIADQIGALVTRDRSIPMLIMDPLTLLIHFIIIVKVEHFPEYLDCIIRYIYRLVVIRTTMSVLIPLSDQQRKLVVSKGPLAPLFAMVANHLRECLDPLQNVINSRKHFPNYQDWSIDDITCEVREQSLHFLRAASLFKYEIQKEELPASMDPLAEPGALEQYLGVWDTCSVVNTAAMGHMCGSLTAAEAPQAMTLKPLVETRQGDLWAVCGAWCAQARAFALHAPSSAALLLIDHKFSSPKLLSLPHSYEELFSIYHTKKCRMCGVLPRDVGVCLVCGDCVCMRRPCASSSSDFASLKHAQDCGNGTGVFISVSQAAIYVVRGERIGFWGCIHLDTFGEEDRDLKRGKPLFLSPQRFNVLERQWQMHGFEHSVQKWYAPSRVRNAIVP